MKTTFEEYLQEVGTMTNKQTTTNFLLTFLEDIKKEIEADGYIATIEEAIIRLKNEL